MPAYNPSPMPPKEAWVIPPLMNTNRRVTIYVPDNAARQCLPEDSPGERVEKMYIVVNSYGSAVRSVEGTDGSGMDSPFADYQKHFVFYFVRKADPPQLQATYPSGYIGVLHCIKDIAEFIRLFRCIIFGCPADKCIQFFVVIILYLGLLTAASRLSRSQTSCCPQHSTSTSFTSGKLSSSPLSIFFCSLLLRIYPAIIATMASNTRPTISIHIITNQIFAKVLINLYYSVYLSLQCAK